MPSLPPFSWPEFAILFVAALVGVACVMPYVLELSAGALNNARERMHRPLWVLLALQNAQSAVLFCLATGLGLLLAHQIGLGAPLIEGLLAGRDVTTPALAMIAPAVILGVASAALMLALEITVFWPRLPRKIRDEAPIPALWKRFLASFYGGIDEEILLRLFTLSLLAWLLGFAWHAPDGRPALGALWVATVLAALLFGLGHLPATAALAKLTPLLVVRALLLNGVVGVATGYLYWRYGLEAAILAHCAADIVFHAIGDSIALRVRAASAPAQA
jgi:hypothetical protein